jgi:glutamine amidotransferase
MAAGTPPDEALAAVVRDVLAVTTGRLNLLLTDGASLYATRVGNSLFRRGPVLVSEPLDDDPGWREIPEGTLVVLGAAGSDERPL